MQNDDIHNKIIYFDKETIRNTLQEKNEGTKESQVNTSSSLSGDAEVLASAKISLGVPFLERLGFLLSGKLSASYSIKRDNITTITSTEISEFRKIKPQLIPFKKTHLQDIKNSSTFFRVAGGYLQIVKGGVEGLNTKEFNTVMDSYDGYDTYKIQDDAYVRFNNKAFVSNYKRNDLLQTRMDVYCVYVGTFKPSDFDFVKQINSMQTLISGIDSGQKIIDIYPADVANSIDSLSKSADDIKEEKIGNIKLFDAVYACIPFGGENV